MRARILIGTGLAVALAGGALVYAVPSLAHGPGGWGMMGSYGHMGGYGPGYGHMGGRGGPGAGQWDCPGFAQGGSAGQGYGPGYPMGGWGRGHGMMHRHMHGYGYGQRYNRDDAQSDRNLDLTTDDVKSRMERWLSWRGNPRLQLGAVKETDDNTITADIVTKDNSLVQRFVVDRRTGFTRPDNSEGDSQSGNQSNN